MKRECSQNLSTKFKTILGVVEECSGRTMSYHNYCSIILSKFVYFFLDKTHTTLILLLALLVNMGHGKWVLFLKLTVAKLIVIV